jgi:hypothetical protein
VVVKDSLVPGLSIKGIAGPPGADELVRIVCLPANGHIAIQNARPIAAIPRLTILRRHEGSMSAVQLLASDPVSISRWTACLRAPKHANRGGPSGSPRNGARCACAVAAPPPDSIRLMSSTSSGPLAERNATFCTLDGMPSNIGSGGALQSARESHQLGTEAFPLSRSRVGRHKGAIPALVRLANRERPRKS